MKCVLEAFDEHLKAQGSAGLPMENRQEFLEKLLLFSNTTETKSVYANTVGFYFDDDCKGNTCVKHPTQDATMNLKFIAIVANATFSSPQVHAPLTLSRGECLRRNH